MKKTTLVSGKSIYHDFNETPVFVGNYVSEKRNEDNKLVGFIFSNEDGEEILISSSSAIEKALEMEFNGKPVKTLPNQLEISFYGKVMTKSNKPYNRFQVDIIEIEPIKTKK